MLTVINDIHPRMVGEVESVTAFSICSLVTNAAQYQGMMKSFVAGGFNPDDCEFLYLDNTRGNTADAFEAYNQFLVKATGKYIILCHQDVELLAHDRRVLEQRLKELDALDPQWGLCGNAGGAEDGTLRIRISDRYGADQFRGDLPARVVTLDENFIVAKREANLAVSRDLKGFHFYGSDLCTVADVLGWRSYVIDFHLLHSGKGTTGEDFYQLRDAMEQKYARAFRRRSITSTASALVLGASRRQLAIRALRKGLGKTRRRLAGAKRDK